MMTEGYTPLMKLPVQRVSQEILVAGLKSRDQKALCYGFIGKVFFFIFSICINFIFWQKILTQIFNNILRITHGSEVLAKSPWRTDCIAALWRQLTNSLRVRALPMRSLVVVVILHLGLNPSVATAQQDHAKPKVSVVTAEMKPVSLTEVFTGRVEAVNRVDLIARVPGFVKSINFKDGKTVAASDLLVEIEPDSYKATVTEIQGKIKAAEAAKKLADIELDRQQKLYAKGDAPQAAVQKAEAQQGEADGQVLELQGSLQNAQLNLSYTKITAPFDGRIGLTKLSVGAFVSPNGGTLMSLSTVDPIRVVFPVTDAELLEFRTRRAEASGAEPLKLQLILADDTTYGQTGSIDVTDTEVQSGTDSVLVRGSFPNPDGSLIDNQLVRVVITDPSQQNSLVIPAKALQKDQSGYFVFTVGSDGVAKKTQVQLDRTEGPDAVISGGLSEGDQVITDGLQKVHAGVEVSVSMPKDASSKIDGN